MKDEFNEEIKKLNHLLNGNKIIGNELIRLYDNKDFFDYINTIAEDILINAMKAPLTEKSNYYIIIISLSFISLKYYDGSLWEHIEKVYKNLYQKYSEQKIYSKIKDILNLFEENASRYINFPICNSIVPEYYLDKYFEFMFDIYKINFQKSLPENLNEELKFIFNCLSDSISGEKDELDIDVTNKTYKLIKTTLNIIKGKSNIDSLIELSSNVLKCIDSYYWNDSTVYYLKTTYLKIGFEKWKNQNEEVDRIRNIDINSNRENRSAWKSRYKLRNNHIYLCTPIHRITKDHDPSKLNISIYNEKKLLSLENSPIVEESIGGYYVVKPQDVRIENPIGKLTYILSDDKGEIYNSKDSLYRDFIAFDENGNELKNNNEYEGNLLIASDNFNNTDINIIANYDKYMLGEILVNIGDVISIKNSYMVLSNRLKNPLIIGEKNIKIYALKTDRKVEVFHSVNKAIFEIDVKPNRVMIVIDNKRYKLESLNVLIEDKKTYYSISMFLDDIKDGYHNIEVKDIVTEKNIANFEFITDSLLDFCYDKITDKEYEILVNSSFELYNEFNENINEFYINIKFSTEPEVYFYFKEEKIKYVISIPIHLYKINNGVWCEFNEYIWGKDVEFYSKLTLKNVEFDKILLVDKKNNEINAFNYNDVIIDIDFIKKYIEDYDELNLKFLKQEIEVDNIEILNVCKYDFNNSYIRYDEDNNVLNIKTCFLGKGKLILKVTNVYSKEIVEKIELNNNSETVINGLHPLWKYNISFEEKAIDFFTIPKCIYSESITLYNTNNLEGKYYKINKAIYGYSLDNLKDIELSNTFINIDERIGNKKYRGRIYQIDYSKENKIIYKNNINPVLIEILSDVKDNIVEVMIVDEKNEDGLLLDRIKRTIYNGDSNNLDDIYTYEILLEKRK